MSAALRGIRVLDLSRVLAGPWASMTLGDLGAEIWKVEHPAGGDDTRKWHPPTIGDTSTYFLAANRNKKSIAIDMQRETGREIVCALAERADILVENFRPSSLRSLGLSFDDLRARNPRLIYCSVSGYGHNTPFAERSGYDFVLQAEAGFMSITGAPDGPPTRLGVAFVDLVTGMNATQAILAALFARERTGRGQHLDIALHHSALHFLANIATGYLNTGDEPARFGHAHPSIVPYQLFDTSDGQIALAVGNDAQFRRLCADVLRDSALACDPDFARNADRTANRARLVALLQARFSEFGADALIAALRLADIPVGRVNGVAAAFATPESRARALVDEMPHPTAGEVRLVRSPLELSDTPVVKPAAPPTLGQHSEVILREVLGWDIARISSAVAEGAVALSADSAGL